MNILKKFLLLGVCLISCACKPIIYDHFLPEQGSPLQITFEYPTDWTWENAHVREVIETYIDKDEFYKGMIYIYVIEGKNKTDEFDQHIGQALRTYALNPSWYEIVSDIQITVDNYPARKVVVKGKEDIESARPKPFYKEFVFLRASDRIYEISLEIPIRDRNSAFGKAFDHLIETLSVIK